MSNLYSVIFTPAGNCVRLLWVLCFSAATIALVLAIRHKRGRLYGVLSLLHFIINFFMLVSVLDGSYAEEFFPEPRRWYFFVDAVYSLPWVVLIITGVISAAISIIFYVNSYKYSLKTVSQSSIKEGVDLLPAGICFGNTKGSIVFTNVAMLGFCRESFSSTFNDVKALWKAVEDEGEAYGDSYMIVTDNSRAILFTKTTIDYYGKPYTQIVASNVSERYKITLDIKDKQKRLLEIQKREKEYGKNVEQLAQAKEVLYMNANFHDEIGHLLLRGRYQLSHPDQGGNEALARILRETNISLFNETSQSSDGDSYLDSLTLAETIGVTVSASGEPPEDKALRELVAKAVQECSVNLVKHAGGDTLFVSFNDDGATFTNNGDPPVGEITEIGGLRSFRKMAEDKGCTVTIESKPVFVLKLSYT